MAKKKPTAKKATKKRVTTKKAATKASPAKKAAWRLYKGDAIGASIARGTALLNLGKGDSVDTGAYSYLFSARNRF